MLAKSIYTQQGKQYLKRQRQVVFAAEKSSPLKKKTDAKTNWRDPAVSIPPHFSHLFYYHTPFFLFNLTSCLPLTPLSSPRKTRHFYVAAATASTSSSHRKDFFMYTMSIHYFQGARYVPDVGIITGPNRPHAESKMVSFNSFASLLYNLRYLCRWCRCHQGNSQTGGSRTTEW
jgi:hypothetical protein